MLFSELVEYSNKIRKASARNEKIKIILEFLSRLNRADAEIGVNYMAGKLKQGRINLAWKNLSQLMQTPRAVADTNLDLRQVDEYVEKSLKARGQEKIKVLYPLFSQLDILEKRHFVDLIIGGVQQGAAEGLVKIAMARFFDLTEHEIDTAYLPMPYLGKLFGYLLDKGKSGINDLSIRVFSPVKPMLAEIAESLSTVYDEYDEFAIEHKLDGIRIQVHKQDETVHIFSRHLKDITPHFPDLVGVVRSLPARELILDGEAIGIDKAGMPTAFQTLARRTTRKKDIDRMKEEVPVEPRFFDALFINGQDLTMKNYAERWQMLEDIIRNKGYLARRILPLNKNQASQFFEESLKNGNEGIMVKLLGSHYRAGKRGRFWFKIKGVHTVDCVVLAAEWGHGRRKGWLSNLHLGVFDETKTRFLMVGKTFKGLTDEMLEWFTANLPKIKVHEDNWTVYVKPEVVVEIEFNVVQNSSKYDAHKALRFARVKKIRRDKNPLEINTIIDLEKLSPSIPRSEGKV